jgi:hypothetical protein
MSNISSPPCNVIENACIQRILKAIDNFLQYKGAYMPVEILLEWHEYLHTVNALISTTTDKRLKKNSLLDNQYLLDTTLEIHKLISFLVGLFDEYRRLEVARAGSL